MWLPLLGSRGNLAPFREEEFQMRFRKSKKPDVAMKLLMRLVAAEGLGLVHDERIRSALRELKRSRKGDEVDTERLMRALILISEVACDVLIDNSK